MHSELIDDDWTDEYALSALLRSGHQGNKETGGDEKMQKALIRGSPKNANPEKKESPK